MQVLDGTRARSDSVGIPTRDHTSMKKFGVIALCLGVLAILASPRTADAGSRNSGHHGHSFQSRRHSAPGHHHRSFPRHDFRHHGLRHHGFGHHRFFPHHSFAFGGVVAAPIVVYSAPPVFYAPPPVYSSATVYAPPVAYSPSPYSQPSPPMPRVVEYSTGRYELRGDGIRTPYVWVWIPNPPPAPPPPPSSTDPSSSDVSPRRRTPAYRWIDSQGVVHWTDRLDAVPRPYRDKAKASDPS